MRRIESRPRVGLLAGVTLLILGASMPAFALAEDGSPRILLLSGNVEEMAATLKGEEWKLETVGGVAITSQSVEFLVKGCKAESGSSADTSLCGPVVVAFTGIKKKTANCHSEMANKEEGDSAEKGTVLMWADMHIAAEENSAKELQPLLLFKVLGALSGESPEELTINCAGVITKVRGVLGCLLTPGLTNIAAEGRLTLSCKIKGKGEAETGKCEKLCEWLTEHPYEAKFSSTFERAWMEGEAKGCLSKENDLFLDD